VTARWELKLTSLHSALLMHDAPAPSRATQRTMGYGDLFLFSSDLHCILKRKEKKYSTTRIRYSELPSQTALCGLKAIFLGSLIQQHFVNADGDPPDGDQLCESLLTWLTRTVLGKWRVWA